MSSSAVASSSANPLDLYESLDVIGNGSFGIIRKVRRKSDNEILARKELNFERMSDRDRKQIVAEVNILKDLHHENIVRYIDRFVDRDNGVLYILMEYCDGGDLSSIIKQCARNNRLLPEDTIWSYFYQLLQALQYCHCPTSKPGDGVDVPKRQQILHRDLKPENVFLSGCNTLKLGDFGLSKALGHTSFANTYVGTPYYMSPELIQEKAYDTKSDIWSLGCLIYELCALKPPFHEAQTHSELANLIRNGRIPPLPKGYSHSLGQMIKAMLNLNPAMRPSAQQLLQHERIEFARKVTETEKLLVAVKTHKTNLSTKEKELQILSESLAQREAALAAVLHQKDLEIHNLTALVAQADARVREAVATREAELRDAVMRREEEVRLALLKRDEEIRDAVNKRQEEINSAWQKREEELRGELKDAVEWVEKRQKELCDQAEELENTRAELEQEADRLSQVKARKEKVPFEEVQNKLAPISDRERDSALEKTPRKAKVDRHLSVVSLETPNVAKLDDKLRIPCPTPGSAMRGIVLTSTGETLATPMPPSRLSATGTELELAKIIKDSPVVGLNFRKIFDFEESETEDEGEEGAECEVEQHSNDESDDTLTVSSRSSSRSGATQRDPLASPTVVVDKRKFVRAVSSNRLSRPRSKTIDRPRPSLPSTSSATGITSTAPTRLRRPSIRVTTQARPKIAVSSSCPNIAPEDAQPTQAPNRAQTLPGSSRPTTAGNGLPVPAATAPRYDPADEENLPSPFLRRVERERVITSNIKQLGSATASGFAGAAVPSSRRKSNGNMLRAIAAANSANNIASISPSPSAIQTPTSVGLRS